MKGQQVIETQRTALYRLFDATDRLLYVGITNNPDFRLYEQHAKEKPWWGDVDQQRTRIVWYDDRPSALRCELAAIHDEKPIHNVVGVRGRPGTRTPPWPTVATTVRFDPTVSAPAREVADEMGVSFNAALSVLVTEALKARGRRPGAQDKPRDSGT
jgi:predicted GIY-YIG superfamily endonuclease